MSELKPCPCGRAPAALELEEGQNYRRGYAVGNCCGEWNVVFRRPSRAFEFGSPENMACAVEAWNKAPRPHAGAELASDPLQLELELDDAR